MTSQSEVGTLRHLVLKHPRDAFADQAAVDAQWRDLGFTARPDFDAAVREYDAFVETIARSGTRVDMLPPATGVTLDSIYVRDASVVCDRGVILCRMGKPQREGEPAAQEAFFRQSGVPVIGSIQPPGRLEGGDVVWLGPRTIAVGRGYRTNDDGIRQLRGFLGDLVDEVIAVALPHWRGPADVFHLMSIISPIDRRMAVVYSPLMSVPFRERLLDDGMTLIDVPDEEFESMGTNVLAIGPGRCVMVAGNPKTRARLERAGVEVFEYAGQEISLKGGGGPTCLTRPMERNSASSARQ
jgi:N-dimethylarginine dimethylaminohydrolase